MLAESETPAEWDAKLARLTRWAWADEIIVGQIPEGATRVFFISDGHANPVEQIEVFKGWVETQGGELARVLTVVNCQLAEKNPPLLAWYEACVHFSDVILLTRREGVANKWLSTFLAHFEKTILPVSLRARERGEGEKPRARPRSARTPDVARLRCGAGLGVHRCRRQRDR
jgi:hypothetical protein